MVMRARWRSFELPTRIEVEKATLTANYGKFTAEPFERGFGITVGNSLRRVLLSSLEGAAVTSVKIEGAQHEFCSLPGVLEDVTDIVLNVKQLLVKVRTEEPRKIKIDVTKKGEVTGRDIMPDAMVEVLNKDLVIATLSEETHFRMEMEVRRGRGYVTAEENDTEDREIGVIPIDSIYSPVRRVRYRTENTRVGQLTDYDKLVLEIWTNGVVGPEMALAEAGKILRKHLIPFVNYFELGETLEAEAPEEEEALAAPPPEGAAEAGLPAEAKPDLSKQFAKPIATLDISTKAKNALEAEGFATLGDIAARSEEDVAKVKGLGKTGAKEVKKALETHGLGFGMDVGAAAKH